MGMKAENLRVLIDETESTVYTDKLLRIIYLLVNDIDPVDQDEKEVVSYIEDIICYLNIKSELEE